MQPLLRRVHAAGLLDTLAPNDARHATGWPGVRFSAKGGKGLKEKNNGEGPSKKTRRDVKQNEECDHKKTKRATTSKNAAGRVSRPVLNRAAPSPPTGAAGRGDDTANADQRVRHHEAARLRAALGRVAARGPIKKDNWDTWWRERQP
eukprot:scaffold4321_cov130-Isochrysis_galbana.AAC.1